MVRTVSCVLAGAAVILGQAGKHEGGHHDGGKKHGGVAGVGYVEESGVVGYSCHEGWEPQGDGPGMVCIHKEKLPLLPHCPVGILEGDTCLLREPAIFSCPPGFVEVGGSHGGKKHGDGGKKHGGKKHGHEGPLCMKVERVPYEPYCPTGTTLAGGQCLRREIAPATMICPLDQWGGKKHGEEGKKHGGGHGGHEGKKHSYIQPACIETIDVLPILTCPPLLTLEGTACIGTGEGPCPMPEPMPLILDGKKHKHSDYRRLGEDDENITEAVGEPVFVAAGPAEENVSESIIDERRLGEKHGHGHGEGGKKHGGYGVPILPPVPSKMKMCTLQIIEPAIPACPPGSFETGNHHGGKKHGGGHGGHGGKKHGGSQGLICSQTVDVPLEPYCPMAGAILNPATMSCESAIYEAEMRKCPLGFEPCDMGSGKKDKHGHGGGKKHHGGNAGGYGQGGCCAVAYADPLPGCPVHSTLLGAQCIIQNQPIFDCPPGSVRNGEKCYIIQTKPPKIHYQINVTTKQATPLIQESGKKHKKHH